jgi:hypothetical protein
MVLLLITVLFVLGVAVTALSAQHARQAQHVASGTQAREAARAGLVEGERLAATDWNHFQRDLYTNEVALDAANTTFYKLTAGQIAVVNGIPLIELQSEGYLKNPDGSYASHATMHVRLAQGTQKGQWGGFLSPVQVLGNAANSCTLVSSNVQNSNVGGIAVLTNSGEANAVWLQNGSVVTGGVTTGPYAAGLSQSQVVNVSGGTISGQVQRAAPVSVATPGLLPVLGHSGTGPLTPPLNVTTSANLVAGNYDTITVAPGATLTMQSGSSFNQLTLGAGSTAHLNGGSFSGGTVTNNGGNLTLSSGQYDQITCTGGTLKLRTGSYQCSDFTLQNNTNLTVGGAVLLSFKDQININNANVNAGGNIGALTIQGTGTATQFNAINGSSNEFYGTVNAPTAAISLNGGSYYGAMAASSFTAQNATIAYKLATNYTNTYAAAGSGPDAAPSPSGAPAVQIVNFEEGD